jgi:hypothetical protein
MQTATDNSNEHAAWTRLHRYLICALPLCLLSFLFFRTSVSVVDLDLYHEMALARESLELGYVPWTDSYAYSPTVPVVVHHEWAVGLVVLAVANAMGASGLILLKYLLVFGLAVLCWWIAARRGASMLNMIVPFGLAAVLSDASFATVRAQMFSFVFAALLLGGFDLDRQGKRWWIVAFVLAFPIWVNMHGGALVGAALLGAHWLEQCIRRQPHWHLILGGLALIPVAAVNPWGFEYHRYLLHAITLPRPAIRESLPLWSAGSDMTIFAYGIAVVILVLYAKQVGWHRLAGIIVVLATALAGMKSVRFLPFFAIAVACYMPSYLSHAQLGRWLDELWTKLRVQLSLIAFIGACLFAVVGWLNNPWTAIVPATPSATNPRQLYYPVGAVEYLRENQFQGNILTPYNFGGYVSWQLHGRAKVFIDSRYEVAYPVSRLDEQSDFYAANDNWHEILDRYPHHAVLVPKSEPVYEALLDETDWQEVYSDQAFAVFASDQTWLPKLSFPQPAFAGSFP